jgi:hypothetical protein
MTQRTTRRGPPRAAPTRPDRRARSRRGSSALRASLAIALGVLVVASLALAGVLATRPPAPGPEPTRDNVAGAADAPILVEEWEDFQ